MKKKILWKDIRQSITGSWGRFLSIFCLMLLGTFVFVGLKVTGPDMRATAEDFYKKTNLADMTIVSNWGLDDTDRALIEKENKIKTIEYGYLKDVVVTNTDTSFRIFSAPNTLSQYEVVDGKMPTNEEEIALDYLQENTYKIGDTISFTEKADNNDETILKQTSFKIVGFVKSSEIVETNNIGQTTVGTGQLNSYAVAKETVFDSDVYMIARMSFIDTEGLNAYSDIYNELIQKHKTSNEELLAGQDEKRLTAMKNDKQKEIDDGWEEINDAKKKLADAQGELEDANTKIEDAKTEVAENQEKLDTTVSDTQKQIDDGQKKITEAKSSISSAEDKLSTAQQQLSSGQSTLNDKWNELQAAKEQLSSAKNTLSTVKKQLDTAASAIQSAKEQMADAKQQIAEKEVSLKGAQSQIDNNQTSLNEKKQEVQNAQSEVTAKQTELNNQKQNVESGRKQYEDGIVKLEQSISEGTNELDTLQSQQAQLQASISDLQSQKAQAESEGNTRKAEELNAEIQTKQSQLDQTTEIITQANQKLSAAKEQLTNTKNAYQDFMSSTYAPGIEKLAAKQKEIDGAQAKVNAANEEINAKQGSLDTAQAQVKQGYQQLSNAKEQLAGQESKLSEKEAEYNVGLEKYNDGVQSYNTNLQRYYDGLSAWQSGADTLSEKSAEYQENVDKVAAAKEELKNKEQELVKGQNTLDTKKAEGQQKINDATSEIGDKEAEYQEKLEDYKKEKTDADKEIADNEQELKDAQEKLDDLEAPVYKVNDRKDANPGYKQYLENSQRIDVLSNVFPVFLFAIAALVSLTTMTRFVEEERITAGTFKALGYSNKDIKMKFLVYGIVSSSLGALSGTILGHTLLPQVIFNAYAASSTFSNVELKFSPIYTIVGFAIAISCTTVAAYVVAVKELKEHAAQLLLAKPPKVGSRILLERITPLWNRMSFTYKVTARNLFRYKKRMFMTIFGVAGCTALLITGFGIKDSLSGVVERQFNDLIKYDLIVVKNNSNSDAETEELNKKLNSKDIKEFTDIYYEELSVIPKKGIDNQNITMIVADDEKTFENYLTLMNREAQENLTILNPGVVISEKLASLLGAKVGDTITLKDENNLQYEMQVSGIAEMYMGHYLFMNKTQYQAIFNKQMTSNSYLVTLDNKAKENISEQSSEFMNLDGVKGVVQSSTLSEKVNAVMGGLNHVIIVLIIAATLLAIVVIYNLTNINVSERIRELSTIKVLGFYDKEVTLYIYRETIILSILGILAGYAVGYFLHAFIVVSLPPDEAMFNPALRAANFGLSAAITLAITLFIMIVMHYKIKSVNMLDALKSVD